MSDWMGLPTPRRWWSVAAIWLALLMAVLDASIANVALPTIARNLHADRASSIWVVNAYQLAIVVSLLPLAALGEIVTYRRVFLGGLSLFTLASVACALSRSLPELALARSVQGLGAAGVMAVNGAIVRYTYPHSQLGRGIGLNALVISVGSVIGPSLASAILSVAPWPFLFAVNLPIGIPALLIAQAALPQSPRANRKLDWIAAGLNVLTFGLVIAGVDLAAREGRPLLGVCAVALGAGAATLLVRRSMGQTRPLAPLDLLRSRTFSLTVLTSIGSFSAQMAALVSLPFLLEGPLHRSQVETGLLITPWPLAVGVAAPLAGRLADRHSAAVLSGVGLAALALGLALLATMGPHATTLAIVWRMVLCGAGFGFFQAPNNRTLLASAPLERSGAAGGMLATARLTGQTIGATLAAICFKVGSEGPLTALGVGALFAAVGAVLSVSRLAGQARAEAPRGAPSGGLLDPSAAKTRPLPKS